MCCSFSVHQKILKMTGIMAAENSVLYIILKLNVKYVKIHDVYHLFTLIFKNKIHVQYIYCKLFFLKV